MSLDALLAHSSSVNEEQGGIASPFLKNSLSPHPYLHFPLSVICYSASYRIHYAKSYIRILPSHVTSFPSSHDIHLLDNRLPSLFYAVSRRLFGSYGLLLSVLWLPFLLSFTLSSPRCGEPLFTCNANSLPRSLRAYASPVRRFCYRCVFQHWFIWSDSVVVLPHSGIPTLFSFFS